MGLAPEARNVLTKEERMQVIGGLQKLESEQRIAAMMELGNLYGEQSGAVAADPAVSGKLAQAPESGGEVYSVYKALGGSTEVLGAGALGLTALETFVPPARLLAWAASFASFQQNQMQSLYEGELYRRGIFKDPTVKP